MSIEKIERELRVAIRAFMAHPSSSDEGKNALQIIDDLRSVKNLRLLLDELFRLREAIEEFGTSRVRDRVAARVGCNHDILHDALQSEVRRALSDRMEGQE